MQRIDSATAATSLPSPAAPGTAGFFAAGNPGAGISFTQTTNDWANGIQEELVAVIQAASITLSKTNLTQLLQAIQALTRTKLTGNLTVYVATTGSDSNAGTISSPFLTLQKAWNHVISGIDTNGFTVTISVANGTYTNGVVCQGSLTGQNGTPVQFVGNTGSPSSCTINVSGNPCFTAASNASIQINGFTLITSGANADCVDASSGSIAAVGTGVVFGTSSHFHLNASNGGTVQAVTNYVISGSATGHFSVGGGVINFGLGNTVTLTGTPNFSSSFAQAAANGAIALDGAATTFTGAATGVRYNATLNGIIAVSGQGANYFPGNSAGSVSNGGQYA